MTEVDLTLFRRPSMIDLSIFYQVFYDRATNDLHAYCCVTHLGTSAYWKELRTAGLLCALAYETSVANIYWPTISDKGLAAIAEHYPEFKPVWEKTLITKTEEALRSSQTR